MSLYPRCLSLIRVFIGFGYFGGGVGVFHGLVVWNVSEALSVGIMLASSLAVSRGCPSRSSPFGSPG